ncbi:pyridoxine kinase [Aequitasia blattaphilus]|uniref:pyridoxal kinase n=1 Tax=Aequitasia blattaphilus TaxID=2949332 RepID=A0ABT1EAG7_9FIRM|nr:pyridoxamine kinase [Aequitasia blattaphilus]MCP1102798.1 pyridoxamine kinase [Aequitasia blattaphilus]MCR8615438.1 pyridoxamine kinase [Aequitasia blattaphilus]
MTKKIAVINDLSGFGRCSLVASISVMSAMGVSVCPLPTAVLSAQTGYPSYYCDDYTQKMDAFTGEWEKMGASFDGIYTGFIANTKQIDKIFNFLDKFYKDETFLLVDPIMGDDGKTYDIFSEELRREFIKLTKHADYVTPNLTELCLLANTSFDRLQSIKDPNDRKREIVEIARSLCGDKDKHIIVTGIHGRDEFGQSYMGNLHVSREGDFFKAFPHIGGSFSGTGDLFASCLAGGVARGEEIKDIITEAGNFIAKAIEDSVREGTPRNDGVNFEKYLSLLIK